jgi:hypothetical protein
MRVSGARSMVGSWSARVAIFVAWPEAKASGIAPRVAEETLTV